MIILFGILIIIASIILGIIVLIQNPKGGGLTGSLGGFSNQLMGVKQTTDVLEKGTWIFAAVVGILCIVSPAFIPKSGAASTTEEMTNSSNATPRQAPANNTAPMQGTNPAPAPVTPAP